MLLAAGGYLSTSIENVVILVGVFCANPANAKAVRLGFGIGSLALLLISLATLTVAAWIPIRYLGLLGLIPITLGIYEIFRSCGKDASDDSTPQNIPQARGEVVLSASLLMVANGGDTIAVFAPLFAETERIGVVVMTVGFILAALGLSFASGRICVLPQLSEPLKKYGPRIAPIIMIGIGIYILLNTGTDLVPD